MPQTLSPRVPEVVAADFAIFLCFLEALLSSACCLEPTYDIIFAMSTSTSSILSVHEDKS